MKIPRISVSGGITVISTLLCLLPLCPLEGNADRKPETYHTGCRLSPTRVLSLQHLGTSPGWGHLSLWTAFPSLKPELNLSDTSCVWRGSGRQTNAALWKYNPLPASVHFVSTCPRALDALLPHLATQASRGGPGHASGGSSFRPCPAASFLNFSPFLASRLSSFLTLNTITVLSILKTSFW